MQKNVMAFTAGSGLGGQEDRHPHMDARPRRRDPVRPEEHCGVKSGVRLMRAANALARQTVARDVHWIDSDQACFSRLHIPYLIKPQS